MKQRHSFLLLSLMCSLALSPSTRADDAGAALAQNQNVSQKQVSEQTDPSVQTNIDSVTKSKEEPKGPAPAVIVNPNPSNVETKATEVKPAIPNKATPHSMEYGYVPEFRPFATGNGKFQVHKHSDRKTMALALGGGGVRGAAHVGVLRVLEKEKIPIDYIVGNSMGAIVGGMYAAGVDLENVCGIKKFSEFRKSYVPTLSAQVVKLPLSVLWSPFRGGPVGVMSGNKYEKFLKKNIPADKQKIEDLNIPFSAVVTNLIDGQAYRISEGDLVTAMRASSTLAPIIRPVIIGDKVCVDGGVRANLPASAARDTGADVVIAVLVDDPLRETTEKKLRHFRAITERMTDIILAVTDEHQMQFADIVISPDVRGISIFSKNKEDIIRAINAGEEAARKALPLIRQKLNLPQAQLSETSRSQ